MTKFEYLFKKKILIPSKSGLFLISNLSEHPCRIPRNTLNLGVISDFQYRTFVLLEKRSPKPRTFSALKSVKTTKGKKLVRTTIFYVFNF